MQTDLRGKTAIVTGAGRGIGKEIARQFAADGATVVVAARTQAEIDRTVEAIEREGSEGLAVRTDLRSVEDVDRLVDRTVETFGAPDVLVNDAAAHHAGAPLERPVEEVDTMLDVNLRALFLLSQRFANAFIDAGKEGGSIVNVSSIVGDVGVPGMVMYCATKAGVHGMTRALAAELAPHGIRVNSLSPGFTRTARIERLLEEKGELYALENIPLDRLAAPGDIADGCRFLVSDGAAYVTGIDLPVDGGIRMTAATYPYD
ncbi:MAG: SDR family NAD(P)-dependent oxidoreductase [Salinigranum sp.]